MMKKIIEQYAANLSDEQAIDMHNDFNRFGDMLEERVKELSMTKEEPQKPLIVCNWNVSIQPEQMQPKTIYLDGSCRGFALRSDIGSISFDHHTGCNRSITYATCVQVMHAIMHGLKPTDFNQIIIDDIDADTVMSVYLLMNPHVLDAQENVDMVNAIGLVDAHFTVAFESHPLHKVINPKYGYTRTEELLHECLSIVDQYIQTKELPSPKWVQSSQPVDVAYGILRSGNYCSGISNFETMYADGFEVVMMVKELPNGSHIYTIGKRSEFAMWFNLPRLLEQLADLEKFYCVEGGLEEPTKNWGGSTTIGGSARYADQSQGSYLPIELVLECIQENAWR